jgi:hypothetical protein
MTATYLQTAMYQRMTKISTDPQATARAISAEQFRPKEKTDAIEREPKPTHSNGR